LHAGWLRALDDANCQETEYERAAEPEVRVLTDTASEIATIDGFSYMNYRDEHDHPSRKLPDERRPYPWKRNNHGERHPEIARAKKISLRHFKFHRPSSTASRSLSANAASAHNTERAES
jgi:hypothetical protein